MASCTEQHVTSLDRRRLRGLVFVLLFVVGSSALALAAGLWKTLTDSTSWKVADYIELKETWLFEQGQWLPKTIPESVREIEGWTNIDDGSVMLSFYIDPRDIGELTAQFRELAPEEFPAMFRSDGESATVVRCFEQVSSDSIYVAFIAFEPDSGRCEYHRPLRVKSPR